MKELKTFEWEKLEVVAIHSEVFSDLIKKNRWDIIDENTKARNEQFVREVKNVKRDMERLMNEIREFNKELVRKEFNNLINC